MVSFTLAADLIDVTLECKIAEQLILCLFDLEIIYSMIVVKISCKLSIGFGLKLISGNFLDNPVAFTKGNIKIKIKHLNT